MQQHSSATRVAILIGIWQRLLDRSSIGTEDNFFDLGGEPSTAIQLFAEIQNAFGRHAPPETIYQFPTIAGLDAFLEMTTPLTCSNVVLMKKGQGLPVFFVHGLGGTVFEFFLLTKHLRSRNPLYGVQAKGMDGVEEPLDRIEDMAQFHLDGIKKVQRNGPYLLVGYSLGGLIALEIARRLLDSGENIELLALVDAYPHRTHLPLWERVKLLFDLLSRHSFATRQSRQLHTRKSAAPGSRRERDSSARALANYRPKFYPGEIKFIRAAIPTAFPDDPATVWADLTSELAVETAPGDHQSMLKTHSESLATILSGYLKEV